MFQASAKKVCYVSISASSVLAQMTQYLLAFNPVVSSEVVQNFLFYCQGRPVPCRARIWWICTVPNISVPRPYDPRHAKYFHAVPCIRTHRESRNPSWIQEPIVNPGTHRESRNLSWMQEPIGNPGTHRESRNLLWIQERYLIGYRESRNLKLK